MDSNQQLRGEIDRLQEREKRRLDMNMSGYAAAPPSPQTHSTTVQSSSGEKPSATTPTTTTTPAPPASDLMEEAREQRLSYLRNAFSRFVQAKDAVEVQNIGRVICTILSFSNDEQAVVNAAIERVSPAIVASSQIDTLSSSVSSFFNF